MMVRCVGEGEGEGTDRQQNMTLTLVDSNLVIVYSTGSSSLDIDPPLAEKITKPPSVN